MSAEPDAVERLSDQNRRRLTVVVGLLSAAAGLAVAWTFPTTASIECRIGDCLVQASRHIPWRIAIVLAGSVVGLLLSRLAHRTDVSSTTVRIAATSGVVAFAAAVLTAVRLRGGWVPADAGSMTSDTWMVFRVTLATAGFALTLATALALRHASGARARARAMALGVLAVCTLGAVSVPSHLVCPVERFWVANDATGRCVDISRGDLTPMPPEPANDPQLPERSLIVAAGVVAAGGVLFAAAPRSTRRPS